MEKSKKEKKKMSNKLFSGIWGSVLAVLLVVLIIGNVVAVQYKTIITRSLGHETIETVNMDTSGNSDYFKSDYASLDELLAREVEISRRIQAEGSVLVKNDENALPLANGAKITFFSLASAKFRYGGGGSGAIDETNVMSLKEAFEAEGFQVNPAVWEMYEKCDQRLPYEIPNSEFSQDVLNSFSEYGDAAIFVYSRPGHEASDLTAEEMRLTEAETELMDFINGKFNKIIVLINAANAIELGWMEDYSNVCAALWIGYPGQEGLLSVPRIINGTVNPSGRLADTYAFSVDSAPAAQNIGYGRVTNGYNDVGAKNAYIVYGENIYVGYRYYETRYEDTVLNAGGASGSTGSINGGAWDYTKEVQYPFGYGLSYTDFAYSNFSITESGDSFKASVTVTNTGAAAGDEVVEFYFQSPFTDYDKENSIEKASIELCAFERTGMIEAGGSVTVETEIPKETLRTFDSKGAKTYIVDAGTYYFTVARDAHGAINNVLAAKGFTTADGMDAEGDTALVASYVQNALDTTTYSVDSTTGTAITNQFDYASMTYFDDSYTYLTRTDWEGTWPSFYGETDEKGNHSMTASQELLDFSQQNHYADDPNAVMPKTNSGADLKLITMRGKAYDDAGWEAILDCLTVEEMMDMVRLGGWQTAVLPSVSKPVSNDQDGPAGISDTLIGSSANCMGYPIQVVLASTWDVELIEEMGKCVGEDGLKANIHGWYAPGAGTHRSSYGGRNFEYYSEDGYLAGKICAAEVAGCQSKGMYVYLKHLVLNDQEERRYGIATFVPEQALREIYLEPFEFAVKDADAHGMMAAFDSIGGIWCGANTELLTNVLRGEWGFTGIVVTDYATANTGYMWIDMGLQAGCDLWLNSDSYVYQIENVDKNPTLVNALRNASHNILYTVVNSSAMNGFNEQTEVRQVMPLWQIWLIALDVVVVAAEAVAVFFIIRRCKKNRQTKA